MSAMFGWRARLERLLADQRRNNWQNGVRITGGYTPFDFSPCPCAGQSLETPEFYGGYSNAGVGGASRLLAPIRA